MVAIKRKSEKIIEDITYLSSNQSITRRIIYALKKYKIKLELKSDGWINQCYARAYALEGLDWKPIYNIPSKEMKTPDGLCYYVSYRNEKAANAKQEFDKDVDRLKKYIAEIL